MLSPTTFPFLTVAGVFQACKVVADCFLGITFKVFKLEMRIALETAVGIEFDDFREREVTIQELVGTCSMDRIVRLFCHGVQKPVDLLFVSRGFGGVVVGQLTTDLLEPVDMLGHIRTMNVTDLFDQLAEGSLSLL